jgi:hypothetical protein
MKSLALALIRHYQACISPLLPPACRFHPTCSEYACEAVERWGVGRGILLAARRLLRCHPFGGLGFDPVPAPPEAPAAKGGDVERAARPAAEIAEAEIFEPEEVATA